MPTRASAPTEDHATKPDAASRDEQSRLPSPQPSSGKPASADSPRSGGGGQGPMDQLARRVLGLRDAEPRALMDLQGSLVVSAVRCIVTYVLVPILLPLAAWADVVATPLDLALSVVAILLAIRSLRRVWQANWTHRWAYTAFIGVVVALLAVSVVVDLGSLSG